MSIELPAEFIKCALASCEPAPDLAVKVLMDYVRREAWQRMESALVEPEPWPPEHISTK